LELEEVYTQLKDSIYYAKRIQDNILPTAQKVKRLLKDGFVLFKPKDIVSGDFYWIEEKNDWVYFAAVDCTGHGVPGAFMSLIGYNILKDIIKNSKQLNPAEILNQLRDNLISILNAEGHSQAKDGMDITLCAINYNTHELQYAAAFNPLIIIRNNELTLYPANKFPVGFYHGEKTPYKTFSFHYNPGDMLYLCSDGYADQFGGPQGKKFKNRRFYQLLQSLAPLSESDQHFRLNQELELWMGSQEQVDDMCIIGIRL